MQAGKASVTALRVAARRAAHQLFDAPLILDDPLAVRIIGSEAERELREHPGRQQGRVRRALRTFIVVRSRLAEDALAESVTRGVRQYVVLGAGLDTSCYRRPPGEGLRMFEVDHPATQAWKRECLAKTGISVPRELTLVSVDFDSQSLAGRLRDCGFDASRPAFFSWLGVTLYLTRDALFGTLRFIGSLPKDTCLVFDYATSAHRFDWSSRLFRWLFARHLAKAGEPFRTQLDPEELASELRTMGFGEVEDAGSDTLNARYCSGRRDGMHVGRIVRIAKATV